MTDDKAADDLLHDSLAAFEALTKPASECRKVLKRRFGQSSGAYAGTGQYLLARHMVGLLRAHLKIKGGVADG